MCHCEMLSWFEVLGPVMCLAGTMPLTQPLCTSCALSGVNENRRCAWVRPHCLEFKSRCFAVVIAVKVEPILLDEWSLRNNFLLRM